MAEVPPVGSREHNIGYACTTLQCLSGRSHAVAMRWLAPDLSRTDYTFGDLDVQSNRFANALLQLGVGAGDVVSVFLPKMPEQFFTFLGILKMQGIAGMLFASFGEEALLDRLADARTKCLVTKKSLLRKITPILPRLGSLQHIIVVDADEPLSPPTVSTVSYRALMDLASTQFETPVTRPSTPSVLHYTSGSTGRPKGVLHVHGGLASLQDTATEVLQLCESDVFWCTADQGWITGTSYGIVAPWSMGVTQIHYGGGFSPERWFTILERERVNVWYSAPTAFRMLMREDDLLYRKFDLSGLRSIFSVGEPLNPEVIQWSRRVLKRDIYDTWFQTETGSIMISNRPGLEIRPGSMGKPVSGVVAEVIAEDGSIQSDGAVGDLCLRPGWPSMFVSYVNDEAAYASKFSHGYYRSGDTAYRDHDGYFWFTGRSDDVINTAGHLISPFEVESALLEIEQITEAGVVGVPDDLLYQKVVAFVSLAKGCVWDAQLELKIRLHLSNKVSSIATPQEIFVLEEIPKTKSGKIMRRVLKAHYLGEDAGDVSTMEI